MNSALSLVWNFLLSNGHFSKWYQTILWWEAYRILFNVIMLIVGIGSIALAAISAPLFYIMIAICLNIGYTLLTILELADKKTVLKEDNLKSLRKKNFISYLIISILVVLTFPVFILSAI